MNEVTITIPVWFLWGVTGYFILAGAMVGYKIYLQHKIDRINCAIARVKAEQKNEQL